MIKSDEYPILVPVVKAKDTVRSVLDLMQENLLKSLPVVDENNIFRGIVFLEDLKTIENKETLLTNLDEGYFKSFYLLPSQHLYEALSIMYNSDLDFLPIIDTEGKLIGTLDRKNLFGILIRLTKAHTPGGMIMLNVPKKDYSIARIASIVESEKAQIVSLFSYYDEEKEEYFLNLKIDREDPGRVIASLERLGYDVEYYTSGADVPVLNLQERLQALLRFMNI